MFSGADVRAYAVKWRDVVPALSKLFPLHWEEVGMPVPLDMDYTAYANLERHGVLQVVVLERGDDIVGYWTVTVSPFLHSRTVRVAHTDLVFIHPAVRNVRTWRMLANAMEEILVDKGVSLWFAGSKERRPIGKLLERNGFMREETAYVKRLGNG